MLDVGHLEGLKISELSSHPSGPCCGMPLGNHGAEVINIARPKEGDWSRGTPLWSAEKAGR